MSNYLGIDWGERRWGLSFGDDLAVATPLPALIEKEEEKRWLSLADIVTKRRINAFVVGYPYNIDGTEGFKIKEVDAFIDQLSKKFSLPVHRVDETLTSYEAEQATPKSKRWDQRSSGIVDSRAATIILQDYLDQIHPL
jgi:putative holliday junction resolvase